MTSWGPRKNRGFLWGKEEQGSERSFRRQTETEPSGLCDDAGMGAFLEKRKEKHFQNK